MPENLSIPTFGKDNWLRNLAFSLPLDRNHYELLSSNYAVIARHFANFLIPMITFIVIIPFTSIYPSMKRV